jgi:hypothetical protein
MAVFQPPGGLSGLIDALLCEIGVLVEEILIGLAIAVADLFGFTAVRAALVPAQVALGNVNCFA